MWVSGYISLTFENGDLVVYFACADSNHNDLQIDIFLKQELALFLGIYCSKLIGEIKC